MRFKVGDRVQIKSLDWYNKNKSKSHGTVACGGKYFEYDMREWCGKTLTIQSMGIDFYLMEEDRLGYEFTDEMIEGLMEEKNNDCEKCGLIHNSTRCLFMDNCPHNKQKNIIGEFAKDENNHITETVVDTVRESNDRYRIVIDSRFDIEVDEGEYYAVRRKKEYPKTYEECCKVMNYCCNPVATKTTHKEELIRKFQFLLLYRDSYWKIAGDEIGLGEPWQPDWNSLEPKYVISISKNSVKLIWEQYYHRVFAFPTEEMRDAFYKNFKELIENCKELL